MKSLKDRNKKAPVFSYIVRPEVAVFKVRAHLRTVLKNFCAAVKVAHDMDQYVAFRNNKRVCLGEEDMTAENLSRIFQVKTKNNNYL